MKPNGEEPEITPAAVPHGSCRLTVMRQIGSPARGCRYW